MSTGRFAMDFGGSYTLSGSEIVHFGLDVIGLFDPSGVADGLNTTMYLGEGDYLNAAISGLGMAAYVGDGAKIPRLFKGYNTVMKSIKQQKAAKIAMKALTHKPCGCFTAGTQVLTEEGYKNIEDIKKGDIVWSFDEKTGNLSPKKVTEIYALEFSQIFKIYVGNEIIEATHEHPFFVGGKWLNVDKLKEGDYVTLYDGSTKKIDKIEFIDAGSFKVYNFEVEDYHSYFVGQSKVLVHNGNPCNIAVDLLQKSIGKHGFKITGKVKQKILGLIENDKLKKIFSELHRENAKIGNGGTAAAVLAEGIGGTHWKKAHDYVQGLKNVIMKGDLGEDDLKVAHYLLNELKNAIKNAK